jgi:hypothetical protein
LILLGIKDWYWWGTSVENILLHFMKTISLIFFIRSDVDVLVCLLSTVLCSILNYYWNKTPCLVKQSVNTHVFSCLLVLVNIFCVGNISYMPVIRKAALTCSFCVEACQYFNRYRSDDKSLIWTSTIKVSTVICIELFVAHFTL